MNHLDKAVTVITGASSGIGAATALALAERGARVALIARSDDKLQALVSKIRAAGGDAAAFKADVTNLEQVKAVVTAIEEQIGPVDILVNNAGLMLFSPWKDTEVADWNNMIDTNLRGYLHAIAAILPGMIVRDSGRILNMSSVAGIHVGDTAACMALPSSSSAALPRACARKSGSRMESRCRWSALA